MPRVLSIRAINDTTSNGGQISLILNAGLLTYVKPRVAPLERNQQMFHVRRFDSATLLIRSNRLMIRVSIDLRRWHAGCSFFG